MKIITVFSTGRSGTALIAQYFGGKIRKRREWKFRENYAISHEPFDDLKQYWQAISSVKRGEEAQISAMINELKKFEKYNTLLITDNKLGRWFYDDLRRLGTETKIIYLYRNENDVIKSLKKTNKPTTMGWAYQASDKYSLTDRTIDPFWYHIKETEKRWIEKRKRLKAEDYVEISFDHFIKDKEHREKLAKFIGLSGYEHMLRRRINYNLPFVKGRVYSLTVSLKKRFIAMINILKK